MTYNKLGFAFIGLRTLSFAIIEKSYNKTGKVNFETNLRFGLDIESRSVACNARFEYENKKGSPFLILELQAIFQIEERDFSSKVKQSKSTYLIVRDLAAHFAVLTIGAARGVLHSKTEGTNFNEYLLPTIDVNNLLKEDLIFKIS